MQNLTDPSQAKTMEEYVSYKSYLNLLFISKKKMNSNFFRCMQSILEKGLTLKFLLRLFVYF